MKFLVINDSSEIIEVLTLCFDLHWPEVELLSAREGKKGLELVRQHAPELVILDVNLPEANGLEVLQWLRSFSDVHVIMLSVSDEQDVDIARYLEAGAADYVVLPFSCTDLMERIQAILRRAHGRQGPAPHAGAPGPPQTCSRCLRRWWPQPGARLV